MALKKLIEFENGVQVNYHKISNITFADGMTTINVEVSSYISDIYRNREKENSENESKYNELFSLILKENEKPEVERNKEQIILWSEEVNRLSNLFRPNLELSIVSRIFIFKNVTDLSLNNIYSLLKEEDIFMNSEDV